MKLIGLILCKCHQKEKPIFLVMSHDLSSFPFFQRNAIKDISKFLTREVIPLLRVGKRESIAHDDYRFHSIRWSDDLAVAMLTDADYPPRVAFKCITELHNDFTSKVPREIFCTIDTDNAAIDYKETMRSFVKQYSDPTKGDAVTSTMGKVEETKEIMQQNLEQVLGNMERINALMEKSEDLSTSTQQMFQTSKKLKKGCCHVM